VSRSEKWTLGTVLVLCLLFLLAVTSEIWRRVLCSNGSDVPVGDGSLDCYGSEAYKHCSPATKFVCHDEEGQ
jgi:hypothetical protein